MEEEGEEEMSVLKHAPSLRAVIRADEICLLGQIVWDGSDQPLSAWA